MSSLLVLSRGVDSGCHGDTTACVFAGHLWSTVFSKAANFKKGKCFLFLKCEFLNSNQHSCVITDVLLISSHFNPRKRHTSSCSTLNSPPTDYMQPVHISLSVKRPNKLLPLCLVLASITFFSRYNYFKRWVSCSK